jgi:hypothetical protein
MNALIKILAERFMSDSPELFKQITKYAVYGGIAGTIVIALPITLPVWVTFGVTLFTGICTGLAGGSSLTTTDEKIKKESNQLFNKKE